MSWVVGIIKKWAGLRVKLIKSGRGFEIYNKMGGTFSITKLQYLGCKLGDAEPSRVGVAAGEDVGVALGSTGTIAGCCCCIWVGDARTKSLIEKNYISESTKFVLGLQKPAPTLNIVLKSSRYDRSIFADSKTWEIVLNIFFL